jgi:hypothetical protein
MRYSPLRIVVGLIESVVTGPPAAGDAVRSGLQAITRTHGNEPSRLMTDEYRRFASAVSMLADWRV